ncbi:unnamed protein product [Caretta caretta]
MDYAFRQMHTPSVETCSALPVYKISVLERSCVAKDRVSPKARSLVCCVCTLDQFSNLVKQNRASWPLSLLVVYL